MAMADLAHHQSGAPVPLAEISDRQNISLNYLEQLFLKLGRAGLVRGLRGPGGGYVLTRSPAKIAIEAIMAAVDEPVKMTRCSGVVGMGCIGSDRCLTHDLWDALGDHLISFLRAVSLQEVLDGTLGQQVRLGELAESAEFSGVLRQPGGHES